jgi:hypothetical protein
MIDSLIDFHFHDCRIRLVDVTPDRLAFPVMAGKAILNRHYSFPLTDTHRPERSETWIVCCICRIKECCNIILTFLSKAAQT